MKAHDAAQLRAGVDVWGWSRALAPGALEAALSRNNEEAPPWIRVNPCKTTIEDAVKTLASHCQQAIKSLN